MDNGALQLLEFRAIVSFQVTGMLLPNPSWPTLLFWQVANQSHNAAVNFANRNASKSQPMSIYALAYGSAVSAALFVSASLTWCVKRSTQLSPSTKMILQRFIPLPATSLASTLNVICIRSPEIKTGIDVFEADGSRVGTSKIAAAQAVKDTAVTRAFLPIPLLLIPPCIMPFFEKLHIVKSRPTVHLLVNAAVCTISFGISLPIALALFPQISSIDAKDLEEEIRQRTSASTLFYNKGL
jgi:tricarboxylate carrier